MAFWKRWATSALLVSACLAAARAGDDSRPAIGSKLELGSFKDVRSLRRTLDDLGPRRASVVVAVRSTCPLARRYLPVLAELEKQYRSKGARFLAIGVDPGESVGELAALAIDSGVEFPVGKGDASWAKALGWRHTPEVVVLDENSRLRYRGRVDDQFRPGGSRPSPTRRDLAEALDAVLEGRDVAIPETPADGCALPEGPAEAEADTGPVPTFHERVEPILQKHCQSCHRPGTSAPFALLTYRDALMQAEAVAEVVDDRTMPPWFAVHDEGLANRRALDDSDRETLIRWVRGGKPKGDPSRRPAARKFPEGRWRIGEPDQVVSMIGEHSIPATGYVDYRYILYPRVFREDTWVRSVEVLPDNPRVVHHANLAYVQAGERFGDANFITGHVPGGDAMILDDGVAYLIPAGSVLILQVHYTTTGKPERSRVSIGLKFPETPVRQRLYHTEVTTHRFQVPPNAPAHPVSARRTLPFDATLLGVVAHMHVRGTDMAFVAHPPDAPAERLVLVPNYNFDWQLAYRWAPGSKHLPKGTVLESVAHYDNSAFNPFNPDPSATVRYGEQTFQEMLIGYWFYTKDGEDLRLRIDPRTGHVRSEPSQPKPGG